MVVVWIAIAINFCLSLVILKRIDGVLSMARSPISPDSPVGPPIGTVLDELPELVRKAPGRPTTLESANLELMIAMTSMCAGCLVTLQELGRRTLKSNYSSTIVKLDGPVTEEDSRGFRTFGTVLSGTPAARLAEILEVSVTPTYYVTDPSGRIVDGGMCRGKGWEGLFET